MVTKKAFMGTGTFEDVVNILDYEQKGFCALRRFLYSRGEESLEFLTKYPVREPVEDSFQICSYFGEATLAPDFFITALGAVNFEQLAELLVKYYTRRAVVCPVYVTKGKSVARSAFEEGKAYFARNKETLTRRYEGKYIAIWNNEILDSDTSFSSLAKRVYEKIGYVSVYMPFVTSKRRILRFHSPKYRRLNADVSTD